MDTVLLRQALDETSAELRATALEFERLQAKKERLEAVVASVTALLNSGTDTPAAKTLPVVPQIHAAAEPKPTWMMARDAFPQNGGTMTVPEISRIINANGAVRNPDAIRIAMRRRPDIFEAQNGGVFALKTTMNGREGSEGAQKTTEAIF
jgi:hypothetical protein